MDKTGMYNNIIVDFGYGTVGVSTSSQFGIESGQKRVVFAPIPPSELDQQLTQDQLLPGTQIIFNFKDKHSIQRIINTLEELKSSVEMFDPIEQVDM